MAKTTHYPVSLEEKGKLFNRQPFSNFDDRANGSGVCFKRITMTTPDGEVIEYDIPIHFGKSKPCPVSFPNK